MNTLDKEVIASLFCIFIVLCLLFTIWIPSLFERVKSHFSNWWRRNICDEVDPDDEEF